jgi:IS5 family transposase
LYLQHTFDCSDELVVNTWVENPYWQYFTGETYLQIQSPIDPSSLTHWRKRIGEEGVETLLLVTIDAARRGGLLKASSLDKIIVDTTVMPKAISHPTDSRLLEKCRQHLVRLVDDNGHGIAPELQPQGATAGSPSGAVCTCAAIQAHEKSGQDAQNKSWPCAP